MLDTLVASVQRTAPVIAGLKAGESALSQIVLAICFPMDSLRYGCIENGYTATVVHNSCSLCAARCGCDQSESRVSLTRNDYDGLYSYFVSTPLKSGRSIAAVVFWQLI